jgi:hypothetical protein
MTANPSARRRRRTAAIAAPVLSAGLTAGVLLGVLVLHPARLVPTAQPAMSTTPVVRTNLTNTVQVGGTVSYAQSYTVINQAAGTAYTWLPAVGAVVRRGHELYEVDGTPVTLFYGLRPQWRALSAGIVPGPDVAQLEQNLIALGYGRQLTVSDYYTAATAYAVDLWQAAAGLPVTGAVPLGQLAFAPGPLRIARDAPSLGSPPQPGSPVLTATSTVPVVTARLPVTQEYLVRPGDQVTVTLPDGVTTTDGVVTVVSSVATAGPSGAGASGPDTVAMTVRLVHPSVTGSLDQAPVSVSIVSARVRDVLAVPISALVALAGGGYAVQVVEAARAAVRLVPVRTGLFSDTLVQVSGQGIAAGLSIEVPSA